MKLKKTGLIAAGAMSVLMAVTPVAGAVTVPDIAPVVPVAAAPGDDIPDTDEPDTVETSTDAADIEEEASTAGRRCVVTSIWKQRGYIRCKTKPLSVDWNPSKSRGFDEQFMAGDNGRIYHAWANGGSGWREMPGDGRAVNIVHAFWGHGGRTIIVEASNGTRWRSTYSNKAWHGWYRA